MATKDFYQIAAKPVVIIPKNLVQRNVEQNDLKSPDSGKPLFFIVDLPCKTMCMTVGNLQPGKKSGKHRHSYESVMYITEGEGYTMIEDKRVDWKAGDAVYFPVWAWHYNVNTSLSKNAKYVSCDNAPQLHSSGVAMFEPAGE
jgi:quercetin dioxygenase-like cupin family protein